MQNLHLPFCGGTGELRGDGSRDANKSVCNEAQVALVPRPKPREIGEDLPDMPEVGNSPQFCDYSRCKNEGVVGVNDVGMKSGNQSPEFGDGPEKRPEQS